MKHIISFFSFITLTLFTCHAQININEIIGVWKVASFTADMPSVSPRLIKDAEVIALANTYLFQKDKKYIKESDYDNNRISGIWEIDSTNQLVMTYEDAGNKQNEKLHIDKLEGGTLHWSQELPGVGTINMKLIKKED